MVSHQIAWNNIVQFIIKCLFLLSGEVLFLWGCPVICCSRSLPLIYFQARLNQALLSFLFILTPDKTHRLSGDWSRGSCFVLAVRSGMAINQVIYCVREGPFSIEFMTCFKKQMLQRYWKFAGYIIICSDGTHSERATGQSSIMIPLPVYMSRWGGPIGGGALPLTEFVLYDYSPETTAD